MPKKGLIAIDIDGTLTHELTSVAQDTIAYLQTLQQQGWIIYIVTGRSFQFSQEVLHALHFPYYLAVQNGAILLEMPQKNILKENYLSHAVIAPMEEICQSEGTDFVIYGGIENNDVSYYRPQNFPSSMQDYLSMRCERFKEKWIAVKSFQDLAIHDFPSLKCFGGKEQMQRIADKLEKKLDLHAPVIKDPFAENCYVMQATYPGVDKGLALEEMCKLLDFKGITIAAGDDINDVPMLQKARYRVVMDTAPSELKKLADIISPAASQHGLIYGLKEILKRTME